MREKIKEIIYSNRHDMWVAFIAIVVVVAFIPLFTYFYFARDLKSSSTIMNRRDTGLVLTDRYNRPFFSFYQAQGKEFVPLSQIPLRTQEAVIAIEDRDFYNHGGFSVQIGRAHV